MINKIDKKYFIKRICEVLGDDYYNHHLKLFSIFLYGSRVYKNAHKDSDYDFIIVRNQLDYKLDGVYSDDGLINCTIYSPCGFQKAINEHEISVLECLSLSEDLIILNDINWIFNLDKTKLREAISKKSSNSFVKSRKKLAEHNFYLAQKSLFHSMRIIMFGKQIAKYGKIINFEECNFVWDEIQTLDYDWDIWKNKYQLYRNNLLSEFRLIAPK